MPQFDITPEEFRRIRKAVFRMNQWEMADLLGVTRNQVQLLEGADTIPRRYSLAMLYLKEHARDMVPA